MANSTSNLALITAAQGNKEVTFNTLLDAASPATLFGRNAMTTTALTWGFFGGDILLDGVLTEIANGTVALTASLTNYVEADRSGVVTANTTAFTAGRTPLYQIVAGASTITSYQDLRMTHAVARGRSLISVAAPHATWTLRTAAALNNWTAIAWNGTVFAAVSSNGTGNRVMTSPDGITWTIRTSAADNDWRAIAWNGTVFAAVAVSGTGNRVMTSPDGITWTIRTSAADNDWRAISWNGTVFAAVSNTGTGNRVMTSPDGITWTIRTSAADNDWKAIAWNGTVFVAVAETGIGNRVMTSPDGITWTIRTSAADNAWLGIAWNGTVFAAVAASGTNRVMTSPDGITWTLRTTPHNNGWNAIAWSGTVFAAVADSGSGSRVAISADGITWSVRATPGSSYDGIAWGGNTFAAVEYAGTDRVMTSPGDPPLTADKVRASILEVTGAITSVQNIVLPLTAQQWTVFNNTTGGFGVQFIGATGTGITVAMGKRAIVYSDGVNIVRATADA